MKTILNNAPIRRFAAVLTVMGAITVAALAPALVLSLVLTQDSEITDVTDDDRNGTVMYTASPSDSDRGDASIEFILPSDIEHIMDNGDLIKVTIEDRGTESTSDSFVDPEFEDGCVFTLRFSDEYRNDEPTEPITGYVKSADADTFVATYSADTKQQLNLCGIYFIDVDLPESSHFPNHP